MSYISVDDVLMVDWSRFCFTYSNRGNDQGDGEGLGVRTRLDLNQVSTRDRTFGGNKDIVSELRS